MKKNFFLLMGIFSIGILQAQVGINTQSPRGIFHIDAGTIGLISDDVIVSKEGNIGLGIPDAKAKIEMVTSTTKGTYVPAFRLEDGNEETMKVLMSEANGDATWGHAKPIGAVLGVFSSTGVLVSINESLSGTYAGLPLVPRPGNTHIRTGGIITLSPGRWWVKVALYMALVANGNESEQVWVRTSLMDDVSGLSASADLEASYTLASNLIWKSPGGTIVGSFILNNKSAASKSYYLSVGGIDNNLQPTTEHNTVFRTGMAGSAENTFIAYRISE